jgi:hypothetical protein
MIVNIAEVWAKVADAHIVYLDRVIDEFLSMHLVMRPQEFRAVTFVRRHRRRIAHRTRSDFSRLILVFERTFPLQAGERKWAVELFKVVFDYGKFSDKHAKGWNAYQLCDGTRWKVCPYCHIHGTETVLPNLISEGFRPQIDHYYPQAVYPFLGLTLGNLIPCCSQCNGPGFKHTKNFYAKPHLNPLSDQENIGFRLESVEPGLSNDPIVRSLRAEDDAYRIGLVPLTSCAKTTASLSTFNLADRYQIYMPEALRISRDVMEKKEWLETQASMMQFADELPDATSREQMRMKLFKFSAPFKSSLAFDPDSEEAYKNRPTGKMQRDIFLRARDKSTIDRT